jgi:hypothetical protein
MRNKFRWLTGFFWPPLRQGGEADRRAQWSVFSIEAVPLFLTCIRQQRNLGAGVKRASERINQRRLVYSH